ncbi:MAG: helix-turn-helix transcriptional regulator, partial [Oscillospiraceae bacterium]|nr:helix-turn-helix transcriptional regulator [Oscillospiraceae bacterium]
MILADKIVRLRKKNGWSQEELAEKMNVSRQAVSKWEGAQTIPDLEKILQLGTLFGVTTDYLLKDEIEDEEFSNDDSSDTTVKKITIEEANTYLEQRKRASWRIALATFL